MPLLFVVGVLCCSNPSNGSITSSMLFHTMHQLPPRCAAHGGFGGGGGFVLFFGGGAAGAVGVGLVHGAVPAGGEFAGVDYSAESSPLF